MAKNQSLPSQEDSDVRRVHTAGAVILAAAVSLAGRESGAVPTREDYRYFRALSIDLQGRMPTPDEITAFEQPNFNLDAWIDQRLTGPMYAERMRRVYMDRLRLEVGRNFGFTSNPIILRRVRVLDPNGQPAYVYFRRGQRRDRAETDGEFCFPPSESGLTIAANNTLSGTATAIPRAAWDRYTVEVKPWWLYRDHRAANPSQRITPPTTTTGPMGFTPVPALFLDADGRTQTTTVRVCREETQPATTGAIYLSGRTAAIPMGQPLPGGRVTQPPLDSGYARAHAGESVSCESGTGVSLSNQCGCGVGLERCMPGAQLAVDPQAFMVPDNYPLGADEPLDNTPQAQSDWARFWWSEEAVRTLEDLFGNDRDVRDLLTGRATMVNGPLVQFYRSGAGSTCCGNGLNFNYVAPVSLVEPQRLPDLMPQDVLTWRRVEDRGPNAAGLLTTPIFLAKYGTRRARAHIVYQAFMCRQFVAENLELMPSEEPNLMVRPGCASCHAALEPMSAYFTRVTESGWTFLPASLFPAQNSACATRNGALPGNCTAFYDRPFSTATTGMLRGAYGSPANADAGPIGLGRSIVASPEFAQCVARNVAESFLGRSMGTDDRPMLTSLATALQSGNYRARALMRAMLRSSAYRSANNLTSDAWRQGATP
jgi:hypothetical protein